MGRAAFVQLTRLLKLNPSPEVRRRVEDILARHAAQSALPRQETQSGSRTTTILAMGSKGKIVAAASPSA